MHNFYAANLKKKINPDVRNQRPRDTQTFTALNIQYTMSILLKLIHAFNATLLRFSGKDLIDIQQVTAKFIWKGKSTATTTII